LNRNPRVNFDRMFQVTAGLLAITGISSAFDVFHLDTKMINFFSAVPCQQKNRIDVAVGEINGFDAVAVGGDFP
jgi:hypothetical protein